VFILITTQSSTCTPKFQSTKAISLT